jgi:hypothetical protein
MKILKKFIPVFFLGFAAIVTHLSEKPSELKIPLTVMAVSLFVFTTYSVFFGNGKGPWDE